MRNIILVFILCIASFVSAAQTIEAENGLLSGTQISTQRAGYSGTGYVTGFDADNDKVTLTATTEAGMHNLYIRYASPSGDKNNYVFVNGQNLGSPQFKAISTFTEIKVGKVYLKKGENTIAIVKEWGYFEVDNIRLEPSPASDFNRVDLNLVTPSPSHEADSLYDFMARVYGKVILSGQYGGTTEFNRIKTVSGKTPVIRGFDFMDYSPSRVEHGSTSTESERIIEWSKQRGITTLAWHWNAPKDLINTTGKEWWRGFYTEATTFDVTKAMNDQTSAEYTLIIRDIDAIAVQLKKLKDTNIPVLWRPLHEAEGRWFWWGAKGPEPCKWLWKLMFDRLVTHHQLNNLIWVWTSSAASTAMEWYPGDQYVDMIGADIYLPAGNYGTNLLMFDNLVSIYSGKKIIAISENGTIPDPENLFIERAAWSWFATWSGNFINDGIQNSAAHINAAFNHEYVITLDEIDQVNAIIQSLEQRRQQMEGEEEEEEQEEVVAVENSAAPKFIFQNPISNDRLIVTVQHSQAVREAILYNPQGKREFAKHNFYISSEAPLEIDFQTKSSGLYLLKIVSDKSVQVFRVIKH